MRFFFSVLCLLIAITLGPVAAFIRSPAIRTTTKSLQSLSNDVISQLEDIKSKYDRLSNDETPGWLAERASLEEIVEKYSTYKEIVIMMGKLRNMCKNEVSEKRRAKQLKSFGELFRGRLIIEEILKEKLGLSFSKDVPEIPELIQYEKADADVTSLQAKVEKVALTIPTGMRTRDKRFSF